jgi:acyl carrier protein
MMKKTNDEISQELRELLAQIADVEQSVFQPDVSIWNVLDSLMGLELSVRIERNYGIRLSKEDLSACKTFQQLVELVNSKLD